MELFYIKELEEGSDMLEVSGELLSHIKALRLKENELISLTNGVGLSCTAKIEKLSKKNAVISLGSFEKEGIEKGFRLGLALGMLDSKERFGFALEKAVELGVTDFYQLQSRYCQKNYFNYERLESKSASALIQCRRKLLPRISFLPDFETLLGETVNYSRIILADVSGTKPDLSSFSSSVLAIVGPEGGFSEEEIEALVKLKHCSVWRLSEARLRSETAAIALVSIILCLSSVEI